MAVWAKGNTVDLSVARMNGFPFLLVDDVDRVWQGIPDTAHHAGNAVAFLVADNFSLDVGIKCHRGLAP
jgi:hypothetical protein